MSQPLFYVAMSGLNATMERMTATANNLANTSTVGFKAQQPVFHALPFYGSGTPNRVTVQSAEDAPDLRAGPVEKTGRSLDVAVKGQGWIAVQAGDGSVAMTRNGALSIAASGMLQTSDGNPVLGTGNTPITLPPLQTVTIGEDGTVSGVPLGQNADQVSALNRIALVNPPETGLHRRSDGLFQSDGGTPSPDAAVRLEVGVLEGSNANPVQLMMQMIENLRSFQMQSEMIKLAGNAAQGQSSPLTIT